MDAPAFTLEQLVAMEAALEAAWAAWKKAEWTKHISYAKDGAGKTYGQTCAFAGVKTAPQDKAGWVDNRVPHKGYATRVFNNIIKPHEAAWAAAEETYKLLSAVAETLIREAQGAQAVCDKFYADMERELDPEGAAARDAEDKLDDEAAEAFGKWVPAKQDSDLLDLMRKRDEDAAREAREDNSDELDELDRIAAENAAREAKEAAKPPLVPDVGDWGAFADRT
jgi:hypothetical protein